MVRAVGMNAERQPRTPGMDAEPGLAQPTDPWPLPLLDLLERTWYEDRFLAYLLAPFGWVYRLVLPLRAAVHRARSRHPGVPVVVIGNLVVGGSGKTPLAIWLVERLAARGWRPGVAVSGYRGRARQWPQQVRPDSDPAAVSDEAVLIARRTTRPVVADPNRVRAATALVRHYGCNLIVCDDGLQHLALERDIEIAVVDGARRYGNLRCLPAGPLREPLSRLQGVDFIVANGTAAEGEYPMRYQAMRLYCLPYPERTMELREYAGRRVHAVAGIGRPQGFFTTLRRAGLELVCHRFPDHHRFRRRDIEFDDALPVLMTEKDAVKCEAFAAKHHWCLPVEAELPLAFERSLLRRLNAEGNGREAA